MKISARQYAKALVELTEGKSDEEISEIAGNFVAVLAEEKALSMWREIVVGIDYVWMEKYGAANVEVISAHAFTQKTLDLLNKAVRGAAISVKVDKDLIGGAKIRIDDRIFDGTIAGQLNRLKTKLVS